MGEAKMELHADFSRRVVLHAADLPWVDSPMPGVARRMLDRIGGEVARATSLVRYAPGSRFSPHVHGGGEEFVVLDGVFEDEMGAYPAGSYIRNPPQSRHTPGSTPGCVIFVKLWQFDPTDRTPVRLNFDRMGAVADAARAGVRTTPLYRNEREDVRIEHWASGAHVFIDCAGGAELFVLDGGLVDGADTLRRHSWLRLPDGPSTALTAAPSGARVWIKTGHLRWAAPPAA
jgi:anti-sigma factor ChrR (cupin superfamily)